MGNANGTPPRVDVGSNPRPGADVQPWVAPSPANASLQDPREAAIWSRLRLRHFTPSGCGVDVAVSAAATSLVVVFERAEPDTSYGLSVLPSWSTTAYVVAADKATTGFTVTFGTGAPGGGGVIQWTSFRSEDA